VRTTPLIAEGHTRRAPPDRPFPCPLTVTSAAIRCPSDTSEPVTGNARTAVTARNPAGEMRKELDNLSAIANAVTHSPPRKRLQIIDMGGYVMLERLTAGHCL